MTETWFDQRPTHPTKPTAYEIAQAASDEAWQDVSDAVDAGEPHDLIAERTAAARLCDANSAAQYDWWMTHYNDPTRSEPAEHIRFMVMA